MADIERVTVTLPADVIREMDRREKNRSRFVAVAVRHELERRRREDLRRSLANPHAESAALADHGLETWARSLPDEDAAALVNSKGGSAVRWVPGKGWQEGRK